jgi:hypothetical protein
VRLGGLAAADRQEAPHQIYVALRKHRVLRAGLADGQRLVEERAGLRILTQGSADLGQRQRGSGAEE